MLFSYTESEWKEIWKKQKNRSFGQKTTVN